jgi:hypothetical protein
MRSASPPRVAAVPWPLNRSGIPPGTDLFLISGLNDLGLRTVHEEGLPVTQEPVADRFGFVPGDHEVHRGRLEMPR